MSVTSVIAHNVVGEVSLAKKLKKAHAKLYPLKYCDSEMPRVKLIPRSISMGSNGVVNNRPRVSED